LDNPKSSIDKAPGQDHNRVYRREKNKINMSVSAALKSRVRRPSYLKKIAKAEDLLHHFPNGAYIGWSGFTGMD